MAFKTVKNNISCVIPFYNEETNSIRRIIRVLLSCKLIQKITVVDDGSESRETFELLKDIFSCYPQIKIVRLSKNYGKSFAVKFGISLCFSENILLLDADLKNIEATEINRAIEEFTTQELDMVVLRRVKSLPLIKLIRADTLLSGERIIKKSHLQNVLRSDVEGYQLELATNQYFVENSLLYKCKWSPSSAVNDYKHRKHKFFKGIFKDLKMYSEIIRYIGFGNFKRQVLHFCKQKV